MNTWLPILAIALSIISLIVAVISFRFSRYVKCAELRSCLLNKIEEARRHLRDAVELAEQAKYEATRSGDLKALQALSCAPDVERIMRQIEGLRTTVEDVSISKVARLYYEEYHKACSS